VNPLLRESAAHVFVESLDAPVVRDDDVHHLARVLRIRPTDALTVSDGAGRWAPARFDGSCVVLTGEVVAELATASRRVFCATPKGDRPELIVQKLTEVGIDEIGFMTTERTVVRRDTRRSEAQLARLRRIAREAAMQSRRVRLPSVSLLDWSAVVACEDLALAEPGGGALTPTVRAIAVGPEGGFTPAELGTCAHRVSLAHQVLRVDTAAIAAGILLMHVAAGADRGSSGMDAP
jgi:16S rRNA (uracil1498-N3)-methyltransferase